MAFFSLSFDGSSEVGVHMRASNNYMIVGQAKNRSIINFLRENFTCPIVETTINTISAVGRQCVGNSNALLLPETCTDQELMHIRNSLPPSVVVARVEEKLKCLGNLVCCNDHVCLVSPELDDETTKVISELLKVPTHRHAIGKELLVGTYGVMNSQGMLAGPEIEVPQLQELGNLLNVQVIAGTVNGGSGAVGGGVVVNDWVQIMGHKSTKVEIKVAESIFNISNTKIPEYIIVDEIVQ